MYIDKFVDGPRVVPKGMTRTAIDKLPNGRPGFRVTQGFGTSHPANDIANFYAGDKVYAPFPGRVVNRKDPNGALIVEVRATDGTIFSVAHLSKFGQTSGATVGRGWLIGYVGSTGLSTSAHMHVAFLTTAGTAQDPWPRLVQNRPARLNGYPINIRNTPSTNGTIYATSQRAGIYTTKGVRIGPWDMALKSGWNWVRGGAHGLGGAYPNDWRKLWINGAYRYVARPLMTLM